MTLDIKTKSVILDLDQTMTTDTGSWLQFTDMVGASQKIHLDIFKRFKAGEISYPTAKKELIDLWKTTAKLDRLSITRMFSKVKLRPGALEGVAYLKSKYKLCIISGAIDIFVANIAQKFDIQDYYSTTKFIFDQNNTLMDFDYILSRGEEKVVFLHDFCNKNGIRPEECAAIGDGASDLPLFNQVALPILFIAHETTLEAKQKITKHMNDWGEISKFL